MVLEPLSDSSEPQCRGTHNRVFGLFLCQQPWLGLMAVSDSDRGRGQCQDQYQPDGNCLSLCRRMVDWTDPKRRGSTGQFAVAGLWRRAEGPATTRGLKRHPVKSLDRKSVV